MRPDQRQVNRLFDAVCRTSHELISELDADGVITFVTDAAVDVLGAEPSELLGVNVFSIIHPDDQARAAAILSHCIDRRTDWMEVRLRILHPNGVVVWVETSGAGRDGRQGPGRPSWPGLTIGDRNHSHRTEKCVSVGRLIGIAL